MALTKVTGQVINTSTDVTVGVLTVTNNLSVGGTLTYEDVTNVDSVGLITARSGVSVTGGEIKVGSGITLSPDGDVFAVGVSTFNSNVLVGSGITLSPDGDGFYTGVVTATTFNGSLAASNLTGALPAIDGSALIGVGGTANINADSVNVTGIITAASFKDANGIGINTANVRTGILDVAGISTFRNPVNVEDSITETVFTITDASSVALDPDNGMIQTWTLGANRTATDSLTTGQSMLLIVTASSSNYTLTWPTMKWSGGSAPTLGGSDPTAIELFKVGSQLYGATVGDLS